MIKQTLYASLLLFLTTLAVAQTPTETPKPILQMIGQLDHKSFNKREAATLRLIQLGRPVIVPLRKLLASAGSSPEAKTRARRIVFTVHWPAPGAAHDGLQLTIKSQTKTFKVGQSIEITARLTNNRGKVRQIHIRSDSPRAAAGLRSAGQAPPPTQLADILRLVVIDAKGGHRSIGVFLNFNRGHLPLDYTMTSKVAEGSVQALLGRVMLKGNSRELLPAGTYRVYAMLEDTLGGSFRHVPKGARLHSNPLTITIR